MRISLHGVVRSFGARTVLDHVDLTLGPRSRLGLVGPNGAGKSTLLRLLAGLDEPDEGRVERTPGIADGRLPAAGARPARRARPSWPTSRAAPASPTRRRRSSAHTASWSPDAYAAALERFLALGGADLEARARATCAELGLAVSLDQETATLSGGEAARAGLAAILLSRFDVLLLDEPTNDLDFDGLDRLERFVDGFAGGLAVVSHDRVFLDRTVTRIAEIDPWTGSAARVRRRLERVRSGARACPRTAVRRLRAIAGANAGGAGAPERSAQPGARRRRDDELGRGDARADDQGAPGGARARARRAGREAVRAVGAASLARSGPASRRPGGVARERRRRAWRLPARPDRPRPRAR